MAKPEKNKKAPPAEETKAETPAEPETAQPGADGASPETAEAAPEKNEPGKNEFEEKYNAEHDSYLRLAADYDNFRKRTVREKDAAYGNGKADAVAKILPIYDNLERALNQPTEDAAYKKGVEMTMNELVKILTGLGAEIFGARGDKFDPALHNAVMHTEDAELPESTVSQVFQKGFKVGGKVVRFAMVQVAN